VAVVVADGLLLVGLAEVVVVVEPLLLEERILVVQVFLDKVIMVVLVLQIAQHSVPAVVEVALVLLAELLAVRQQQPQQAGLDVNIQFQGLQHIILAVVAEMAVLVD